ncbi:MAG: hypothetical protein FJ109_21125, partial [Deltaproteobacteria bacterium]|nr:hypothetical protein [Deltaproteobacteria bacterium]
MADQPRVGRQAYPGWSRCAAGEGGRWADGAGNLTAGAGRLADGAGNLTAGAGPMNRPQCVCCPGEQTG